MPGGCFVSDPVKVSNLAGTVSFAANTREDLCTNINPSADVCSSPDQGDLILTNEIFINTIDNPQYDGVGFAPVGSVVEGMDGTPHSDFPALLTDRCLIGVTVISAIASLGCRA